MDFWEWLAKIALDGIVGATVGGAVTGLAVLWTVGHERKIREQDAADAAHRDLRQLLGRLLASCGRQMFEEVATTTTGPHDDLRLTKAVNDVFSDLMEAEAVAYGVDEALARDLEYARKSIGGLAGDGGFDLEGLSDMRGKLVARLYAWLRVPQMYGRLPSLEESLAVGGTTEPESEITTALLDDSEGPEAPRP